MKTWRLSLGMAFGAAFALLAAAALTLPGRAQSSPQLIQPAELVKLLHGPKNQAPLIIQIGFRTLYEQAHIPGSEYVGPSSQPEGRRELHKRVQALPRSRLIVLYCGCCPWKHCPNVRPGYQELQSMGFRNVKVLYMANNFGADWVDKGYPVSRGQ